MGIKKISCEKVQSLLSLYHENELSDELGHLVFEHLETCKECADIEDNIFQIKSLLPELNEDVPFFLKNRLYLISETEIKDTPPAYSALKWIAAMVGTFILFLNLFYFTNIYPSANRVLHKTVSKIENFVVEARVFIEQIGGSGVPDFFKNNKKISEIEDKKKYKKENSLKIRPDKGVKYG